MLTLIAGAFGIAVGWFRFPSFPASLVGLGWKAATVFVMLVAIRSFEFRDATLVDAGITPVRPRPRRDRAAIAIVGSIALIGVAFAWDSIPGLRNLAASGSGTSYDAGTVTLGLLAFELLVRYPLQVVAEESFFRGFLQPRVAWAAPATTGVLFALYHLQQWRTIPSLIPFGIALGLLYWWLGSIWPGVVLHYVGNAMFILSLYIQHR
jgi:membrane protease YdiL (CAAX protease family)